MKLDFYHKKITTRITMPKELKKWTLKNENAAKTSSQERAKEISNLLE